MSHTDVHRPLHVLMQDPTIRHWFLDEHNHHHGPCDLELFLASPWPRRTRCWRQLWTQAPSLCGCDMCSGNNRLWNKQVRVQWRKVRRDLLKTSIHDRDMMDVPPLRGTSY